MYIKNTFLSTYMFVCSIPFLIMSTSIFYCFNDKMAADKGTESLEIAAH